MVTTGGDGIEYGGGRRIMGNTVLSQSGRSQMSSLKPAGRHTSEMPELEKLESLINIPLQQFLLVYNPYRIPQLIVCKVV